MTPPFKMLLVEDNSDDEHLTMRELRKLGPGLEIDVARDGQQALDMLFDPDRDLPNLVLLDLKLPKVNGLEVLSQLRENPRTAHLLIVVLASSDEPDDVRLSYQMYANSYIRKPVGMAEFSEKVKQLGVYWLGTNISPSG